MNTAVLSLLCLELSMSVGASPVCPHGQSGCHVTSLVDLFDRVLQQSSRMHGISTDLHSEFEQNSIPSRNFIRKPKCHTSGIPTPADKENAKRLGGDQLTEVILRLLGAWDDPLWQLYRSISQDHNQDFYQHGSNKALEISDVVHELRGGVEKMAEKMKFLGILSNTVHSVSPETLPSSSAFAFYKKEDLNSMDHHDLLYCFHRDSNKVKNYLRVLKCTILPGLDC